MPELAASRPRAERFLGAAARLLALAAGVCVLAALGALALPSLLRVTRFDVRGSACMTREEVLAAALLRPGEPFFSASPERAKAALESDPRVASAKVSRLFPNGLRVEVAERRPVASVLVEAGGTQALACLDAEGVAFALAGGSYPPAGALPVLSGLRIENFRPGARLPAELAAPLRALGEIASREPALAAAFSEIKISRSRYGEVELLLYPMRHRVPARTGPSPSASDLRSILLVLDVLGSRGMEAAVSELDFRAGTVVYRGKEGHPD